ncbi:hypothetical protein COO91_01140 [Nostoc flagelliforme CCNUN1]|uniref:Uncharacterized protein n=1 Tax=Nostoc flagelliforme CCNUN1 TaxID=2038116 RepID=A0A2K8SIG9_9NOSO|nr:hypothetical protein [Nostoc flagelliforme]AUB35264.1 hypothetical protein COO91_01140 [Nostoc flagelliforme CCNUN1]
MYCCRVEAKKRFNADKELQKRKFELAQRHRRWRSLLVTFRSNEYMLWQAG